MIQPQAGITQLIEQINSGSSTAQRETAVRRLAGYRQPENLPIFLKVLNETCPTLRSAALEAIVLTPGGELALPRLLKCLTDRRWLVRETCVKVLAQFGAPAAVPGLVKLVEDSIKQAPGEPRQLETTIGALELLGNLRAASAKDATGVTTVLIRALNLNGRGTVVTEWQLAYKWAAALSLGRLDNAVATRALVDAFSKLTDADPPAFREVLLVALQLPQSPTSIQELVSSLEVRPFENRQEAYARQILLIALLTKHKHTSSAVLTQLKKMAHSPSRQVRQAVAESLGDYPCVNPTVRQLVLKLMRDEHLEVRTKAITTWRQIILDYKVSA